MGAPSAAKRAPAKKAPARKAADPNEVPAELRNFYDQVDQDSEGVSLDFVTPSQDVQAAEMEKLFSIDGVDYLIPKQFGPHVGLVYIDALQDGPDVAIGRVMRAALGRAGWTALRDYEHLTPQQLKKLMAVVMKKVMGAVEEEQGNG